MNNQLNTSKRLKLLVVNATATSSFNKIRKEILNKYLRKDTDLDIVSLPYGSSTLAFSIQEIGNAIEVIKIIKNLEGQGYSGVLINCFLDPGLEEAKECVEIPIVGAGQVAMNYAAMFSHKFAVITPGKKMIPQVEKKVLIYGLEKKLAGIFPMTIGVTQLQRREVGSEFIEELLKLETEAVSRGAEMLVFGCTAIIGLVAELQKQKHRHFSLPILDPSVIGIKVLEAVADIYRLTGLAQSKVLRYLPPAELPPFLK